MKLERLPLVITAMAVMALAACAQFTPSTSTSTSTPTSTPTPTLAPGRDQLLAELKTCGPTTGSACARIHLALAEHYLSGPASSQTLEAAARELEMARQNPAVARESAPLYRAVQGWRNEREKRQQADIQLAATRARLARIEGLLHEKAQKAIDQPGPSPTAP